MCNNLTNLAIFILLRVIDLFISWYFRSRSKSLWGRHCRWCRYTSLHSLVLCNSWLNINQLASFFFLMDFAAKAKCNPGWNEKMEVSHSVHLDRFFGYVGSTNHVSMLCEIQSLTTFWKLVNIHSLRAECKRCYSPGIRSIPPEILCGLQALWGRKHIHLLHKAEWVSSAKYTVMSWALG